MDCCPTSPFPRAGCGLLLAGLEVSKCSAQGSALQPDWLGAGVTIGSVEEGDRSGAGCQWVERVVLVLEKPVQVEDWITGEHWSQIKTILFKTKNTFKKEKQQARGKVFRSGNDYHARACAKSSKSLHGTRYLQAPLQPPQYVNIPNQECGSMWEWFLSPLLSACPKLSSFNSPPQQFAHRSSLHSPPEDIPSLPSHPTHLSHTPASRSPGRHPYQSVRALRSLPALRPQVGLDCGLTKDDQKDWMKDLSNVKGGRMGHQPLGPLYAFGTRCNAQKPFEL